MNNVATKWTQDVIKSLKHDYIHHLSKDEMEKKYNTSWDAIRHQVHKLKIKRVRKCKERKTFKLSSEEMKELYLNNVSSCKIAEMSGASEDIVRVRLIKQGIKIKDKVQLAKEHRLYTLNENIFDNEFNQDLAYFYGFLCGDGNNYVKEGKISLSLQARDKHILESFNKLIGSNRPLRFRDNSKKNNSQNSYVLDICSRYISTKLAALGLVNAKCHVLTFPEWMPHNLYKHLIRGVFDADGCLYVNKKDYSKCRFSIAGTFNFLANIQEIMIKELDLPKTEIDINGKTSNIHYGGCLQINKIMEWLYQDANLYLYRKYEKFQYFLNRTPNIAPNKKKVIDIKTGIIYPSASQAARESKLTYSHISKALCGDRKNTTPYMYLDQFIKQNPSHPISIQHTNTQPIKQTA